MAFDTETFSAQFHVKFVFFNFPGSLSCWFYVLLKYGDFKKKVACFLKFPDSVPFFRFYLDTFFYCLFLSYSGIILPSTVSPLRGALPWKGVLPCEFHVHRGQTAMCLPNIRLNKTSWSIILGQWKPVSCFRVFLFSESLESLQLPSASMTSDNCRSFCILYHGDFLPPGFAIDVVHWFLFSVLL